ncbi:MAG: acetamidase/formamidase family protein [Paracoccaceae bacterium]
MTTHHFTPTQWHNVLATLPAALTVESGDTIVTETIDANGWDKHDQKVMHGPNPMNGPIAVEGAMPGDRLKVEILSMDPIRATGWTRAALAENVVDPTFVSSLPPRDRATWSIDHNARTVTLQDSPPGLENFVLPLAPMIGCFGVAPNGGQAISTATSAEHGGNMDYRRLGPGATVWFPISVPGALFFLGDCHAIQGDGEIVGTGVETCFQVTVRLTVEKRTILWPRGETARDMFTLGNARPLDQALQHATTEMVRWLGEDYGLDIVAAGHLLGQCVRYDIGNVYDPAFTVACRLPKAILRR